MDIRAVLLWTILSKSFFDNSAAEYVQRRRIIPLGAFLQTSEYRLGVREALRFAKAQHNAVSSRSYTLQIAEEILQAPVNNSYTVWSAVCERLKDGFLMMLSNGDTDSVSAYDSLAETMHIPYINWNLPAGALARPGGLSPFRVRKFKQYFSVSVRPPTDEILADIIIDKEWTNITYIHDGLDASLNLQRIYSWIHNKTFNQRPIFMVHAEMIQLPSSTADFSDFVYKFHRDRYNVSADISFHAVVDIVSVERQLFFLKALQQVSLKTPEKFHYVMSGFELTPSDVAKFDKGFLNFTVLQIVRPNEDHIWRFQDAYNNYLQSLRMPGFPETDMPVSIAFVYDAILVALKTLDIIHIENPTVFNSTFSRGRIYNGDYPGIYCNPAEDLVNRQRPFLPFEYGKQLAWTMRNKVHIPQSEALTSEIRFNEKGIRVGYSVEVVELTYSTRSAFSTKTRSLWVQGYGFATNQSKDTHERYYGMNNTTNRVRVVTTVLTKPFMMLKKDKHGNVIGTGNDRFEGYCVDLLTQLTEVMGMEFNIRLVADGKYGAPNPDGTWNGMIGELLDGVADGALAPLTITKTRERVVDFSKPFMTTGLSIMIKKPDQQEFSVFSFMQPLSTEIWMYILFALVGVSVVIFLVSRFSPYEWRVEEMANGSFVISNDFSVYNCLWFTVAALMQQGTDILPRSVSGRIASSAWWFFTMIIISSYTANLAAFLTSEKLQASIESVEDLAKQTKIKYGIQYGGSTAAFFQQSTVQTYQRMWQYMKSQKPPVMVDSYDTGIQRVRDSKGRYAFILEATANEYANTREPCNTMKVGDPLNTVGYGIATPFGSDLKNEINLAILDLQEKGELKKLENKWWYGRGQCEKDSSDGQSASLDLAKVAGIFYILIGGMILAMLAAMAELLYRSRIEARKGKQTLGHSMRAQLSLSMKGTEGDYANKAVHDVIADGARGLSDAGRLAHVDHKGRQVLNGAKLPAHFHPAQETDENGEDNDTLMKPPTRENTSELKSPYNTPV